MEARAKELGLDPQARKELRQAESMPILLQFGRWLADTYNAEPPKSPLAKAAGYSVPASPIHRPASMGRRHASVPGRTVTPLRQWVQILKCEVDAC